MSRHSLNVLALWYEPVLYQTITQPNAQSTIASDTKLGTVTYILYLISRKFELLEFLVVIHGKFWLQVLQSTQSISKSTTRYPTIFWLYFIDKTLTTRHTASLSSSSQETQGLRWVLDNSIITIISIFSKGNTYNFLCDHFIYFRKCWSCFKQDIQIDVFIDSSYIRLHIHVSKNSLAFVQMYAVQRACDRLNHFPNDN